MIDLLKKNFLYAVLLLGVLYTGWMVQQARNANTPIVVSKSNMDTFAENITAISMDENGDPKSKLFSPKVKHYPTEDTSLFSKPHFIFYPRRGEPWHTTAENGKSIHGNEQVILWEKVKVTQTDPKKNRELTMTTSKLNVFPNKDLATTDVAVQFTDEGSVINSIGMNAFLKEKRIELLSKTRSVYDQASKKLA